MTKQRATYQCIECGTKTVKWVGCCPQCKLWNTINEVHVTVATSVVAKSKASVMSMQPLTAVVGSSKKRMLSGIDEWDRVTGGGIMPGAFIMLTGDPGIGKSTLLLQITYNLARNYKVLYFSSEESLEQVKNRAERLGCLSEDILFSDQANLDEIIATTHHYKPDLIIIDSIQNCYASQSATLPGSIGQLKESAFYCMRLAKEHAVAILLSGHITKDGCMAGPKTLEHMVDAVLYLQGEDRWQTRVLRSVKNRFGTVNELGFFEMGESGLHEMPNINQHLLEEITENPGSVLISYIEGSRPLLLELQALTIASKYGIPQRVVTGIEQKQVILIAAILEKYLQIKLSAQDIFFKISGSLKIKGSSADLGIALALLSSYFQQPLPSKSLALGEISLTGQIKPINHINLHINEIEKFGISQLLLAKNQKLTGTRCTTKKFSHVYELLKVFENV